MRTTAASMDPEGARFTLARAVTGDAKYKDAEQRKYAHVQLVVFPAAAKDPEFQWEANHGELPYDYMPAACRKAVQQFLSEPLPDGGRLTHVCVRITGGSYHDRDTDPAAVKRATILALRDALSRATLVGIDQPAPVIEKQNVEPGEIIRWRLHIPVPAERVFAALDSDEGRAAFWAESAVERDGVIEFRFINGVSHHSRVLTRRATGEWSIEYFGGVARFELKSDGRGGTELELTHTGVSADQWHDTHAGWLNVLFPLKAWLVHGVDLRNHDPTRTWDDGYADQ